MRCDLCRYVIHVNDIVGMIQGKHDLNGVCTVMNECMSDGVGTHSVKNWRKKNVCL